MMSDTHEIEVKFVLTDPAALRTRLIDYGAATEGQYREISHRLDTPDGNLRSQERHLRVRRTIHKDNTTRCLLTVKTPPNGDNDPRFKVRREIETVVDDCDALIQGLEALGYETYLVYEKNRETFLLDNVVICLDHTPIGWFMEIEGSKAGITAMADRLGFALADALLISYPMLFHLFKTAFDIDADHLTFEELAGVSIDPTFYQTV